MNVQQNIICRFAISENIRSFFYVGIKRDALSLQ